MQAEIHSKRRSEKWMDGWVGKEIGSKRKLKNG